jgi:putative ABC transport system permease protein
MFRLTLKGLAAKRLRLLTTALAVMLGVAFLAGTLVLSDTLSRTLSGLVTKAHEGTDAYVRPVSAVEQRFAANGAHLAADLAATVAAVPGVRSVSPEVTGYAQLVGADGEPVGDLGEGAPVLGLSWGDVPELNAYDLDDGRAPMGADEIVIDQRSARDGGFTIGDRATVLSQHAPKAYTIVGIARFGSADSMGGASVTLFDLPTAAAVLASPGEIDGLAVAADPGISQEEVASRIADVLPAETEVITGATLADEEAQSATEGLGFLKTFLLIFAMVAVFVGAFIIFNTFSILVAQRTREMALLRAIGASRRQVLRSVLIESVVIGTLASIAGIVAGLGLAKVLKLLLDQVGVALPVGGTVLTTGTIVVCLVIGVGITVASAVFPARRAARIAPVAAMRDVSVDRADRSRRRLITGTVATAAGVAALLAGMAGAGAALVGLGALVTYLGVAILGPVLARPVAGFLGAPLRRFRGVPGTIARENALRNPKRTAATAAALMIGVGLVAFITVFAASVRASVSGSLSDQFRGHYIVDSGAAGAGGLSPELAARLGEADGVTAVASTRTADILVDGQAESIQAWTPATVGELFELGSVEGSTADLGPDGIAVERARAEANGWSVGSTVPVTFAGSGSVSFTVEAIFEQSDEWVGTAFLATDALDIHQPGLLDSRLYVRLAEGTDVEAARAGLAQVTGDFAVAELQDRAEFMAATNSDIDQMLGLIYAMLALAVIIALMGIANTLALSIFERSRELGLLRAVGMTRSQVRAAIRWESMIIALFGTVLGLAIGLFFGWAMVRGMASQGFDELRIPVTQLAVVVGVAALAGVGASVLPARRAARLDVLGAIVSD